MADDAPPQPQREESVLPALFKAVEGLPMAPSTRFALQQTFTPLLEEDDDTQSYAALLASLSGVAERAHRARLLSLLACTCKAAKDLADGDEPTADAAAMRRAVEAQAASLLEVTSLLASSNLLHHDVAKCLAALSEGDAVVEAPQVGDEEPPHEAWERLTERVTLAVERDVDESEMGHEELQSLTPRSMSDLVGRIKHERVIVALRDYV